MSEMSYLLMLQRILDEGEFHADRTGVGTWSRFGHEQLEFDLREGFPLLTTKKVFMRGITEELIWFLNGRTDVQTLQDKNVHIWDEWATPEKCGVFDREPGDLGPIYGHQWRNFGGEYFPSANFGMWPPPDGVDQIAWLLNEIQTNPASRRLIVSAWDPATQGQVTLPPCHTLFQCRVHEGGKLGGTIDLKLYARSIDSFLGLPFNIASYAMLVHLIAWYTGLVPGKLFISFGDVHIYTNHVDAVKLQLTREPRPLPKFWIQGNRDQYPDLRGLTPDMFRLEGYSPHEEIKAPVAV
jgi:thymidylate synthase